MKSSSFNDIIKPIIVLVCICLVVSFLLAYVNGITEPIIEENARIKEAETIAAVMEGASGFTLLTDDEMGSAVKINGISKICKENSGLGYVIIAGNKGYGGTVTVTVGIDNSGKVIGLSADVGTETSGVGSKAGKSDYTDKYLGAVGSTNVDKISGATFSSTAVRNGVNQALLAFAEMN